MKENLMDDRESIEKTVMGFYEKIIDDKNHRFKSWEHCYNYFNGDSIEIDLACLHLGFYLASWGMLRNSFLLKKDYKIHENAVREIVKSEYKVLRGIKFQDFTPDKIKLLSRLIKKLNDEIYGISISDTLITKILLGTLGCVPAYDKCFIIGIRQAKLKYSKLSESCFENHFQELLNWCGKNQNEIQNISKKINDTQKIKGEIEYPFMKIVDMYFWSIGMNTTGKLEIKTFDKTGDDFGYQCAKCDGDTFDFPDSPKSTDIVKCVNCGASNTYEVFHVNALKLACEKSGYSPELVEAILAEQKNAIDL